MTATIPIDQLLADIAPDNPCGDDLEYDPEFGALDRESRPVAEQVMGETVIPGREPDWSAVRRRALDLLGRTMDLRVSVLLARSLLNTNGLEGLRDGLTLLVRLVNERWEDVHPRLDPDDDLDPTTRVNILTNLCDKETFLKDLRTAPLVVSPAFGLIRYRDLLAATGEITTVAEVGKTPGLDLTQIKAAFRDADPDAVVATADAARRAHAEIVVLETVLTTKVGVQHAANFAPLAGPLAAIEGFMDERLMDLGLVETPPAAPVAAGGAKGNLPPEAAASARAEPSGEVTSRDDVVRLLDRICAYYARYEPASPVPILLQRAKRLVPMQFVDIIRDLAPDALATIEVYRGADTPGETD